MEEIEIKYELTLEYRCSAHVARHGLGGAWLRPLLASRSRVAGLAVAVAALEFSSARPRSAVSQTAGVPASLPDCQSQSVSASAEQLLTCYLRRHDETE